MSAKVSWIGSIADPNTDAVRTRLPRLLLTAGEPAGIGPELLVRLAQRSVRASLIAISDPDLLEATAKRLELPLTLVRVDACDASLPHVVGQLAVFPVALAAPVVPGVLNVENSAFVLETLRRACDACLAGDAEAIVTGPLHKGIINIAGTPFSGHTEFLGERAGAPPLMLLAAGALRVALVTTHLPLRAVPAAITRAAVLESGQRLAAGLRQRFGIERPRIAVLGLNPHAGEGGVLGDEEIREIAPAIEALRALGIDATGPLSADTAFVPARLAAFDAVLAMYHDQALPVLKHAGFGDAVNVTLGLPFIRTSVDHGVALDIAAQGTADVSSLVSATLLAIAMAERARSCA